MFPRLDKPPLARYPSPMATQATAPVVAIGALNLDLCGTPTAALRARDSNPGRITITAGGVGHNIAREIARGGTAVELLTALGSDDAAVLLARRCEAEGVGLAHALRLPGASGAYLCVHDEGGDMTVAVNDMALLDTLPDTPPPAWLAALNAAPMAVLDANLPKPLFTALARSAKTPLLLDPVSGFKAERARDVIGLFAAVKPNRLEAKQLSGEDDPARAASWFLARGVRSVFISLGAEGVYWADAGSRGTLPAAHVHATGFTGAGDAMAAGIALGMLGGLDAEGCARSGMRAVADYLVQQR